MGVKRVSGRLACRSQYVSRTHPTNHMIYLSSDFSDHDLTDRTRPVELQRIGFESSQLWVRLEPQTQKAVLFMDTTSSTTHRYPQGPGLDEYIDNSLGSLNTWCRVPLDPSFIFSLCLEKHEFLGPVFLRNPRDPPPTIVLLTF